MPRIGDLVFDATNKVLWGLRHLVRYVSLGAQAVSLRQLESCAPVAVWRSCVFELDVSADGKYLSASLGEITGRST